MSDIYIPGLRSRFNTEQVVEDLMRLERLPRDRAAENLEKLRAEKIYWQDLGRRITSLRDNARALYSFQNPFNDRIVRSSDDYVLSGTANRESLEQERSFTVKQTAQADRFLSSPLEENTQVEAGTYTFTVGRDEISFDFRGGNLRDFADMLSRRGGDKIQASLITIRSGTRSLLIESKQTGEENRLGFTGISERFAQQIGMIEPAHDMRRDIGNGISRVNAGETQSFAIEGGISSATPGLIIRFDTSTSVRPSEPWLPPAPPPGPDIPSSGYLAYGNIVIENESTTVTLPEWNAPEQPERTDDLRLIALKFSDGTSAFLPPISDTQDFRSQTYRLDEYAGNKTIVSIEVINKNTHRDVNIQNIEIFDPSAASGVRPLNPVSTARDAIISMEGIEVQRPTNTIDDLIPGVTLTVKSASANPVRLTIEPDREGVKDAIIGLVGSYNRLMAEINVLTRGDVENSDFSVSRLSNVLDDLTYLTREEQEEYRQRLGAFRGDSALNTLRANLQRAITTPYLTSAERDLTLLSQIGIGTDLRRTGATTGYDSSRLMGYLEIDEKVLDAAIANNLPAMKELFGNDTTGDLIADTGVAFTLETMSRPYVEIGGIISLKTGGVDTRIVSEQRRIDTMDRQLTNREAELRAQYAQMDNAYSRMERMSGTLDNFNQQFNNNNNR